MAAVGIRVMVVVMVRGKMDAVGLFQGLGIHHFFGGSLAANDTVERIHAAGVSIDHGKVVRDKDHREPSSSVHLGDEFVKVGLTRGVYTGRGFIEQEQFGLVEET
jgi:hypothetical protein